MFLIRIYQNKRSSRGKLKTPNVFESNHNNAFVVVRSLRATHVSEKSAKVLFRELSNIMDGFTN